jgi:penicillin-binding protein 1A
LARRTARARKEPDFDDEEDDDVLDDEEDGEEEERPKRTRARKRGKKKRKRSWLGHTIYWGAVLSLWLVIGAFGTVVWVGMHLPPIQSLEIPKRPPSIQILGLDGKLLATRGDMGGESIPLKELPPYVPKAFIAIEDRRFYSHNGIDPIGLARAVVANAMHRAVAQGGSTITQQLAKNLFLTQDRTISRKLQEVALALWLEHKFSKSKILELYLNRVYFGAGAYGVEAASQRYFGKSARHLTLGESALLAGLVKSPSRLAPTHNFAAAQRRAETVVAAMVDAGLIKEADAKAAAKQPPRIVTASPGGSVNYVADFVMDALNEILGHIDNDVIVQTSIDPSLQAAAEKAVVEELTQRGQKLDVEQGALVAMTPEGAVRALVGGVNYSESQFNRAVSAKRQPGSAFKPFVYLTALEHGLTPDTVREDKPITVKGWKPENYSKEYFGPVTLTQALANSLNTVSVRLTLEFGATAVARTAYRLGISSRLEPNASLALGTSEVSPLELVSAYAPFANGGFAITPHVIERVRSSDNVLLYARQPEPLGRVIHPEYVYMMNQMMRETLISGTARRATLPGWSAAGKTGTSQDFRDAWFVGYTSHLVTGVWVGNDDSSPTKKVTGSGLPVDIWTRFMKAAHQGVPVAALPSSGPVANVFRAQYGDVQEGAVPRPSENVAPTTASVSRRNDLDGWFIDRLFNRR